MNRFLIDECLSPILAEAARARGFDATHVVWLGRQSATDRTLAALALERDYVIVSNNARDFRKIYRRLEVHPGLLLILPDLRADMQRRYFLALLDFVEQQPDIVNQIVVIDAKGHIAIESWSE